MPRLPVITALPIPAKSDTALLARIVGLNRTPVTVATIASIAATLTDLTLGTVLQSAVALAVASVVYDTLQQNDSAWVKDSPNSPAPPAPVSDGSSGYNFRYVLPAAQIPNHGHKYLAEVQFTMLDGSVLVQQFQWTTLPGYR